MALNRQAKNSETFDETFASTARRRQTANLPWAWPPIRRLRMTHKKLDRVGDFESAERIAARQDQCAIEFVATARQAIANALSAAQASKDKRNAAKIFEAAKEAGFREAVAKLLFYAIGRAEFDALPLLDAAAAFARGDDRIPSSEVGLSRWQVGPNWVLVWTNANGTAAFYRPEMVDGSVPLN